MISRLLLVFCCFCMGYNAGAQEQLSSNKKPLAFHSFTSCGLLKGASETAFDFQTVNGLQLHDWFAGLGVGLDNYYYSTLPLFLDVRKKISEHLSSFFWYADGGINFSLEKEVSDWPGHHKDYKSGLYYDAGIVYSQSFGRKSSLTLSAGYTQKDFKLKETSRYFLLQQEVPGYVITHQYSFRRLVLKMGIGF